MLLQRILCFRRQQSWKWRDDFCICRLVSSENLTKGTDNWNLSASSLLIQLTVPLSLQGDMTDVHEALKHPRDECVCVYVSVTCSSLCSPLTVCVCCLLHSSSLFLTLSSRRDNTHSWFRCSSRTHTLFLSHTLCRWAICSERGKKNRVGEVQKSTSTFYPHGKYNVHSLSANCCKCVTAGRHMKWNLVAQCHLAGLWKYSEGLRPLNDATVLDKTPIYSYSQEANVSRLAPILLFNMFANIKQDKATFIRWSPFKQTEIWLAFE